MPQTLAAYLQIIVVGKYEHGIFFKIFQAINPKKLIYPRFGVLQRLFT